MLRSFKNKIHSTILATAHCYATPRLPLGFMQKVFSKLNFLPHPQANLFIHNVELYQFDFLLLLFMPRTSAFRASRVAIFYIPVIPSGNRVKNRNSTGKGKKLNQYN